MFKSRKEFELAMVEALIKIRDGENYQSLDTKYDLSDLREAVKECIDSGYTINMTATRAESGDINIDTCPPPKVTLSGLKFIDAHA